MTDIVNGEIKLDTTNTYAIEKQVTIAVGYGSALSAWNAATNYTGSTSNYYGKIFDNVGWVRGTRSASTNWGAYIWVLQNRIKFQAGTSEWWSTTNGIPVRITNVMVGSLGNYQPTNNVDDIGPMIPSNFPGANLGDVGTYQVDITNVFYELVIPDIWVTPRDAVTVVDGSNVEFEVTGTNIPLGVAWTISPTNFEGHAGFQSATNYYAEVIPGSVATNYKVRATAKNNTNFWDEVTLEVVKVDIVQSNVYVGAGSSNNASFYLSADSSTNVTWTISPDIGTNGAKFASGPSGAGTVSTWAGTNIWLSSGNVGTSYTIRAYATDFTNCYDTATGIVIKIEITNIKFNWDTNSSSSDAINIRQDYSNAYDISAGEWVKDVTNIPVCYTINKSVTIKTRFTVQPESITDADIWAVATDTEGSLGDVLKTNVTFSGGVSSPEYVTFQIFDTMPSCIQKTAVDVWQWKMENVNGSGSSACNINTSGVHTVYTLLAEPVSPWDNTAGNSKNAWTRALDNSCAWADLESTDSGCMTKIAQKIYSDLGGQYDTYQGAPQYTDDGSTANFKLSKFLDAVASTNIGTVNCYDCGKAVVTLSSLLGCNALYKYSTPFGYLNCIKPIGKGWANNPFYDNPSYTNAPVTGEDDDYSNGRSGFGNHAFGSVSTNIWDGCLKGNTGINPDTTNNVVETWMTGQSWNTYQAIVVDDVPAIATGSPINYQFGLE